MTGERGATAEERNGGTMGITTSSEDLAGRPRRRRTAAVAAVAFIGIAGFEAALALGAPLGNAAWGGANAHLAMGLRIASAGSMAVWVLAALVVLGRAGYRVSRIPYRVCHTGTWVLVGYLALGTLMNLASPSNWERFLQAPIALAVAVLCLLVARSATPPARELSPGSAASGGPIADHAASSALASPPARPHH
jgi:hypothetical protein